MTRAGSNTPPLTCRPLPKYLIALALQTGSSPDPPATEMVRWYRNTSTRFGSHQMLADARWPSVFLGALGCVALMALGTLGLIDRRAGLLAGLLLADQPALRHARPTRYVRRPNRGLHPARLRPGPLGMDAWTTIHPQTVSSPGSEILGSGALAGLAVLSKLSGGLAVMILVGLDSSSSRRSRRIPPRSRSRPRSAAILSLLLLLRRASLRSNPFLISSLPREPSFSSPGLLKRGLLGAPCSCSNTGRGLGSRSGRLPERRHSHCHLESRRCRRTGLRALRPTGAEAYCAPRKAQRPRAPDLGLRLHHPLRLEAGCRRAASGLPLVLAGAAVALPTRASASTNTGNPPAAWAILLQWTITLVTVTAFLPLAWDRYFLPLQAPSRLLASAALVAAFDHFDTAAVTRQESPRS